METFNLFNNFMSFFGNCLNQCVVLAMFYNFLTILIYIAIIFEKDVKTTHWIISSLSLSAISSIKDENIDANNIGKYSYNAENQETEDVIILKDRKSVV